MVIDSMGHSNRQTSFQIVSQQLQPRTMALPFGLLQPDRHNTQQCPERMVSSSPVDFVASDISLDGLTVDSMSQSVLSQEMAIKQEQKLLIAQSKSLDQGHKRIRMHVDVASVNAGLGVDVDEMDDISSDDVGCDDEGITLNQHHQQLLEQQQQYGLTSHHPHHQAQAQALHGLHHRSAQLEMGLEAVEEWSRVVRSLTNLPRLLGRVQFPVAMWRPPDATTTIVAHSLPLPCPWEVGT